MKFQIILIGLLIAVMVTGCAEEAPCEPCVQVNTTICDQSICDTCEVCEEIPVCPEINETVIECTVCENCTEWKLSNMTKYAMCDFGCESVFSRSDSVNLTDVDQDDLCKEICIEFK